tara:strand:- start:4447 stop:4860 length:414 start_codon:yes stop_codon:yes gene_type:complete
MKKSELQSFIKENIVEILSEEDVKDIEAKQKAQDLLNQAKEKEIELDKQRSKLGEIDNDDDDKDAVKAAMGAKGKFKKLDLAVKSLKDIETEMKSLARKYGSADDIEKEKIKGILRVKTSIKKEAEALVAKLEKNVV